MSDDGFKPFARLNLFSRLQKELEAERLRVLRGIAYVPVDASEEEAWAHVGRYAANNYFDQMTKRPPGRPRVKRSIDVQRALKVCRIIEVGEAKTIAAAIRLYSDRADPDFPARHRGERTLLNSVMRGLAIVEKELERVAELNKLAAATGDRSARKDAAKIMARLNPDIFP